MGRGFGKVTYNIFFNNSLVNEYFFLKILYYKSGQILFKTSLIKPDRFITAMLGYLWSGLPRYICR
jgi:hypothetical protein